MGMEQLILEQNQQTTEDGYKFTNTGDSGTPVAIKWKLTALDKLFGPDKLSQQSVTLKNKLEKYLLEPPILRKNPSYMVDS